MVKVELFVPPARMPEIRVDGVPVWTVSSRGKGVQVARALLESFTDGKPCLSIGGTSTPMAAHEAVALAGALLTAVAPRFRTGGSAS